MELVVIESPETIVRLKIFGIACWEGPLSVARIVKLNEPVSGGCSAKCPTS